MSIRGWFGPWLEERRDRARIARAYRRALREWISRELAKWARGLNLRVSIPLWLLSPAVYILWGLLRGRSLDWVGFVVVALGPPLLFTLATFVVLVHRGPAHVFDYYKSEYDRANPPLPFVVAIHVIDDEQVAIRLLLSGGTGEVLLDEVSCEVVVGAVRPHSVTSKSGSVSTTQPIEFSYPDEFANAVWPLPDGVYEVGCKVQSATPEFNGTVGQQFRIGPRKRRLWWA